jgi:hypothetical protein
MLNVRFPPIADISSRALAFGCAWPIERAVLEGAAHDYPASADRLREQIAAAQVTDFENTGVGFFSTVRVSREAPQLTDQSPLDAATGTVPASSTEWAFWFSLRTATFL